VERAQLRLLETALEPSGRHETLGSGAHDGSGAFVGVLTEPALGTIVAAPAPIVGPGLVGRIAKRSIDLVGGLIALVLLGPLMILAALAIRLDSRGKPFFRQTRIGRDGAAFTMWKFRTMVDGADELKPSMLGLNEAEGLFKITADPRVTRVGRWLRATSLDELPQLFNVIRGEMSLVGPRPLVPDDDARVTGAARRRLKLTPGMTGTWQIHGSALAPVSEMTVLDCSYVDEWSLWTDLKILLQTVPYVLGRRGM
jgi:lipopolysaccharide/colanic/teichoic acid biosynthesis glycosyltransferase